MISKVPHRSEFEEATQTGFARALLRQELTRQREAKMGHVALILVGRGSHPKSLIIHQISVSISMYMQDR